MTRIEKIETKGPIVGWMGLVQNMKGRVDTRRNAASLRERERGEDDMMQWGGRGIRVRRRAPGVGK